MKKQNILSKFIVIFQGEKPVEQAETEQKADEGGEPEQEQQADDDAGGDDQNATKFIHA